MAQRSGFNWGGLSMGTKAALILGALLLIDLFLPWNRVCVDFGGAQIPGIDSCASASGATGAFGVLALLFTIALLAWEGLNAAGVLANVNAPRKLITAILAAGAGLFALLRVLLNLTAASFGAWIGIVLGLALLYAAYVNWQENTATTGGMAPPPAPPAA